MVPTRLPRCATALLLAAAPLAALAHTGHADPTLGFAAGLAHPFGGADHLLAMLAVGLWSTAALPAGRRALAPALFVGAMALAATLAQAGRLAPLHGALEHGALEALLAASVLLLGALLVGGARVAPPLGLALSALAGALHGSAHGLEMAGGLSFAAYAAGFVLASAILHAVGLGTGVMLLRWRGGALRVAGWLVGLTGAAMLAVRL